MSFSQQINAIKAAIRKQHEDTVRDVASTVHRTLARATPIDTSRARTNWVPTIDVPFEGESPYVMGKGGSTASAAERLTASEMLRISNAYRFGQSIWLVNNTPYIIRLDQGWSPQFAGDFIGLAHQTAQAVIRTKT